ncbi:MAG: hypothetical protein WC947_09940 [Elusimicrobiota bacterium]
MKYKKILIFIWWIFSAILIIGWNQADIKHREIETNKVTGKVFDKEKILSKLYDYNKEIELNNNIFASDENKAYKLIRGTKKVLLSAPHATQHIRDDREKGRDVLTGAIVRVLQELTDCYAIYTTHKTRFDPNWYDDTSYKEEIRKLIETENIIVVLDIHGAAERRPFEVDFGTMYGDSLLGEDYLLDKLILLLNKNDIRDLSFNFFSAQGQRTTTCFVADYGTPAVQIEINRKLRGKDREKTLKLIKALYEYIEGF